ncbi:MAG: hypothetical protein H6739_42600, partial [Alphaproteobacteria bacterium]|nr:hypothetical protein [Alphaproteobacteria bacterium]
MLRKLLKVLAALLALLLWGASPQLSEYPHRGMTPMARVSGPPAISAAARAFDLTPGGGPGKLRVDAFAAFATNDRLYFSRYNRLGMLNRHGYSITPLRDYDVEVSLVDGDALRPLGCRLRGLSPGLKECDLALPDDLPEGDHTLRVALVQRAQARPVVLEMDLPWYRRAWIHVLADTPLVRPGETLQVRALALEAESGRPLAERPGTWTVHDPEGRIRIEEPGRTSALGVHHVAFPLGPDAPEGVWEIRWASGEDVGAVAVEVRRDALPPGTLSLWSDAAWLGPGQGTTVHGVLRSASGAPMPRTPVSLSAEVPGWPPPRDWFQELETDDAGHFTAALSPLPDDLDAPRTLTLSAVATGLGVPIEGSHPLNLSPTPIVAEGRTVLGAALAPGLPNLAYVTVRTPDGRPLADTEVRIRSRWDAVEAPVVARTDADGVAAARLSPRGAVTLSPPPMPARAPPPAPPAFALIDARDIMGARPADRDTLDALGTLVEALEPRCGVLAGTETFHVRLQALSGRVDGVDVPDDALGDCLEAALLGRPAPRGVLGMTLQGREPPHVRLNVHVVEPSRSEDFAFSTVGSRARLAETCLGDEPPPQPLVLAYAARDGRLRILGAEGEAGWPACVRATLEGVPLDGPGWGVVTLTPQAPPPATPPTDATDATRTGFEYLVEAPDGAAAVLRFDEGKPAPLRVEPSEVLLDPGQPFEVRLLRGPDGVLPDTLSFDGTTRNLKGTTAALTAPDQPG